MYTTDSKISLQNMNEMLQLACWTHGNSDFYLVPATTNVLWINQQLRRHGCKCDAVLRVNEVAGPMGELQ